MLGEEEGAQKLAGHPKLMSLNHQAFVWQLKWKFTIMEDGIIQEAMKKLLINTINGICRKDYQLHCFACKTKGQGGIEGCSGRPDVKGRLLEQLLKV